VAFDHTLDAPVLIVDDGEPAKYRREGHPARSIDVVVLRNPPEPAAGAKPMRGRDVMHVLVLNDNQTGISSDEIDPGRDTIELPPRPGMTPVRKTITTVLGVDPGSMKLEVQ